MWYLANSFEAKHRQIAQYLLGIINNKIKPFVAKCISVHSQESAAEIDHFLQISSIELSDGAIQINK